METMRMTRDERIAALEKRDGPDCFLCKKPFKDKSEITFDHFWVPQSMGGTWDLGNLVLAHKRCNALKGDRIPNPDGTLPPLKRETSIPRAVKRSQRPTVCEVCDSGRKLGPDEECETCGSGPMPPNYPQWAKLKPNECEHSGIWWCWACMSGIVIREPASKYVFGYDE